ncbi:hypothetical protein [Pseudomonas sp. T8]|uniref:hypothetical protein n=1 Tax=Pseudomonas sp. T8 TaxID=645292 RepID=UPI002148DF46|nr:hypothetical protein [Pseudomonas sp. T8]UUT24111.1 hypothetical protein NRG23_09160 [Pseudomonas sp. T8]
MDESREIERFSALVSLAGHPELFDSAYELAVLRDDAVQAGVEMGEFLLGYRLAGELGSQSPPGRLLSCLSVYEKVREMAALYRANPSDDSWMPDLYHRESYRSSMAKAVDIIDDLYAEALNEVRLYELSNGIKGE